ncbi:MAG: MBOAT family O-acyltransferase [Oscillospiraceae bacterium]
MTFGSYLFILGFFPVALIGWLLLGRWGQPRWRSLWLVASSMVFYGYASPVALLFLMVEGGVSYGLGVGMLRVPARKKAFALLGAVVLVGVLLYFKYTGFFLSGVNSLMGTSLQWVAPAVPLGLSFLTFRQLLFLRDCYRGEIDNLTPTDYALFLGFFPTVTSGPITRYGELQSQLDTRFSWENFGMGLYCFSLGLAKKVLVADTLAGAVTYGYGHLQNLSSTDALITILCYTLQLYFDFSGYCDMAHGLCKMLGIDLPVNFNSPYRAVSVSDFWARWHITLSRFFRLCVYIPMGGNRKGLFRTCINIMAIFLLSGLWHGAGWGFLLWGALHGGAMVLERLLKGRLKVPKLLGWALTFVFLNVAWVYFRAPTVADGTALLSAVFSGGFALPSGGMAAALQWSEVTGAMKFLALSLPTLAAQIGYVLPLCAVPLSLLLLFFRNPVEQLNSFRPTVSKAVLSTVCLCWSIFSLSGVTQFLDVNF